MSERYHAIYFEISGICNARCAYCQSGVQRPAKAKFVDPELFRGVLTRLLTEHVIQPGTVISLYNWGEPTLHPQLGTIVGIINALGLRYALSTNASRVPVIDREFVRNLDHVIFSMPGFSQAAYDRIHGFQFAQITANIEHIVKGCRSQGFKGRFSISYHVYRFNVGEMKACERFADERGILFNPYFAILNHWWEINAYMNGSLPAERREAAERDLFTLEGMATILALAPQKGYRCPQNNYLNIDENGVIATCCQIARDHPDYGCGNAQQGDLAAALRLKGRKPVCSQCIGSGLAFYLNTTLKRPDFYRPSLYQRTRRLLRRARELPLVLSRWFRE